MGTGTVTAKGDYRIQNKETDDDGNIIYSRSNGRLCMSDDKARLNVFGSFFTQSIYGNGSNENYLTAGTLDLKGDFTQISAGNSYNFDARGNHKTVFSGDTVQNIHFDNPNNSHFYFLILRNDITSGYTFTSGTKYYAFADPHHIVNTSALSAASIQLGQTVTVNMSALGGLEPYAYAAYYKKTSSNQWTAIQSYSVANHSVTFKPASAVSYDVRVSVMDVNGTESSQYFTLQVNKPLANTSSLSAETVTITDGVTVNCSAANGAGSYQYAVYYKTAAASNWKSVQNYSSSNTVLIKPDAIGTYNILVKVKDANGKIEKKEMTVKVTKSALRNESTISADTIRLGEPLIVNCSVNGGKNPYQYTVLYKKSSVTKWTTAQPYNENNMVSLHLKAAVSYDIVIKAKDADGKIARKEFTVTVTK